MRRIVKIGHIPPKKIISFTCGYCGTIFTEDFDPGVIYTSLCPICGKAVVFVEESIGLYKSE